MRRAWHLATQHRAFTAVFTAGLVLRLLSQIAYWPAVLFPDSLDYISTTQQLKPGIWHPLGYSYFLWLLMPLHSFAVVTISQHVMGLACGVLVYRALRRLQVGPALATAASATLLLDPMQVVLEQYILSDVLFLFLLVVAFVVALRKRVTPRVAVGVGLLVAAATITRTIAAVVLVGIGACWLFSLRGRPWQDHAKVAVAGLAAFAVPVLGYVADYHHVYGDVAMQGFSGRWLYGRVASFADCAVDQQPPRLRPLCANAPRDSRLGPPDYVWDTGLNYAAAALPPNRRVRNTVAGEFARRAIVHQPMDYLGAVTSDVLHTFAPGRATDARQWFAGSWYFYLPGQPNFWRVQVARGPLRARIAATKTVTALPVARLLHSYERVVYTPGPLGGVAALIIVVGPLFGRGRRTRGACALFGVSGLLLLVMPMLSVDFDYRYVLSGLQLMSVGAAAGAVAIARRLQSQPPQWWSSPRRPTVSRPTLVAVGVVAGIGMLLSNVLGPQAYPGGHFWNGRPVAAGGWVTVGHRFRISLSRPELFNAVCRRRVVHDQFMMRLDERWLSGGALVAMPDNLVVRGRLRAAALVGQPYDTAGIFRPQRLTSRHPDDAGNVLIDVGAHTGRLTAVYIDPLGAGGAGWGLGSPEQLSSSVPGAPCAAVPRRAAAG